MGKEGHIYRAFQKSARDEKPSGKKDEAPEYGPLASTSEVRSSEGDVSSFRRIREGSREPHPSLVVVHDKWGAAASQVRAVRDKILAMDKKSPLRVITVTSGTRQEGKSTMSANLAAALSEVGKGRVLLLDGDVRGVGLDVALNLDNGEGLYEILNNGLTLDRRVRETTIPGLDVIESGALEDISECQSILAQRCDTLLAELRRYYKFIIVDTPPVLVSSEARIFAKNSDGTVVVARQESTPREVVKRAVKELSESGANVVGCVLTDRKHYVPNFIYRLVGHSPKYYYHYGKYSKYSKYGRYGKKKAKDENGASKD